MEHRAGRHRQGGGKHALPADSHGIGTSRTKARAIGMLVAVVGSLYLVIAPSSFAASGGIHNSGVQELDGSIDFTGNTTDFNGAVPAADQVTPTVAPYDWNSLFTGAGTGGSISTTGAACQVGSCAGLVNDFAAPYDGTLFTKGSKDVQDVSQWSCTQQSTPPKDQLVNAYGSAWTAPAAAGAITQGDTLMFLGLERPSTNGNSNAGFWLFRSQVICNPTTGQFSTSVTGTVAATHSNGDLFLVGSFLSGGSNAVLDAFTWNCTQVSATNPACASTGSLGSTPTIVGSLNCPANTGTSDSFCEVVNQKTVNGTTTNWGVSTPWTNIATGSGPIPGPGFLEMGIDLSQALGSPGAPAPCFASFLTDTRSSGSSTQAETKNFINGSFPTCGGLQVHKYIDQNLNGHFDSGTDLNGAGWPISVTNPSGTIICSGTTGADGNLTCQAGQSGLTNLPGGSYTVSETQKAGFYNTDPGTGTACNDAAASSTSPPDASDVNEAATVSCTIQVSNGASATAQVGNQCTVALSFQVTGLPPSTTGVKASWSVTAGFDSGKSSSASGSGNLADVTLTPTTAGGSTYQGTSTFPFIQNDKVTWFFYVNSDATHTEPGKTGVDLSGNLFGSPAGCGNTSAAPFAPSSVEGFKFKDVTGTGFAANGSVPAGDNPLGGVQFQLLSGASVVGTATSSGTDGSFTFTKVNPGTYTLHELAPTGWVQTGPTGPSDYTLTVHLGDGTVTTDTTGRTLNFLDTPTYDFSMNFQSLANLPGTTTAATHGAITCSPNPSTSTGSGSGSYSSGTQAGASQTYSCSLVVTDP